MGSRLLYSLPALLLALLALILAIVGLTQEQGAADRTEATRVQPVQRSDQYSYWAATGPMKAGETVNADKLTKVSSPSAIPGVISTDQKVPGQTLQRDVLPGELISAGIFRENKEALASVLPAGRRALALPVNDVSGAGGLLRPGDTVDVITAFNHSKDKKGPAALVTLQGIPVLAVHGRLDQAGDDKKEQRNRNNTVVLSVPADKVTTLMLASAKGDIRLAVVATKEAAKAGGSDESAAQKNDVTVVAETNSPKEKTGSTVASQPGMAEGTESTQPFYYDDFFPSKHKKAVRTVTPSRPRGHRVEVFEGSETRSTYVH